MNKKLGLVALVGGIAVVGAAPVVWADGHAQCGGQYHASVEVAQVDLPDNPSGLMAVSYCSDGTLSEAGVPGEDTVQDSQCGGGDHAATVELDTGWLPENPTGIFQATWCSDDFIEEMGL